MIKVTDINGMELKVGDPVEVVDDLGSASYQDKIGFLGKIIKIES